MKKIFAALFALMSSVAFGATLNPIQLLNPSGSTAGQAILSTGASTAPAWGNVSVSTLTGVLPVANGGTNVSTASGTALDNITGFAGTGFLTRTGAGTYAFQSTTNGITLGNIAQIGANTVLGNATGSTANIAALNVPSCSTSSSAVQYTSASGWGCNTSVNAATLGGATFASPGAIGSTTAGSGAFTTLSASSTVSGSGFSTYLASPPAIGGTTAAAGAFTTLSATGLITPSTTNGIKGTTAADNANAGSIGEYICAQVTNGGSPSGCSTNSSTPVSLTTNTPANVTSVSLTAGDWRVCGTVSVSFSGQTGTSAFGGINTTSATFPASNVYSGQNLGTTTMSGLSVLTCNPRINVASTTTAYLVAQGGFASGTATAIGYIWAERRR